MRYIILFIIVFLCAGKIAMAQRETDSVSVHFRRYAASKKDDTAKFEFYARLSNDYRRGNYDSSLYYGRLALALSKRMNYKSGEVLSLSDIEFALRETGDLDEALNIQLAAFDEAREINNKALECIELNSIGNTYLELGDPETGLGYYRRSRALVSSVGKVSAFTSELLINEYWVRNETSNMGNAFEKMGQLDSALAYETKLYNDKKFPPDLMPELLGRFGTLKVRLGDDTEAMRLYKKGAALSFPEQTINDRAIIYYQMALLFNKWRQPDSSIFYARKSFYTAQTISLRKIMLSASTLLAQVYDKEKRLDSAFYYQRIEINYNDTLFGVAKFRHIQLIFSNEQIRQQKILQDQEDMRLRYEIIGTVGTLIFVLLILFLVWRNSRLQKRKNRLLNLQKTQITTQRDELKATVDDLHKTQTQLIQSEKMASLGELTAGIAHEIQNPLNFVNNFSEVNREMVDELEEELKKGNINEALAIVADIKQNEEKINHHGKRADFIVKGMLQHSRTSTGERQLTNINVLADEFLKLSYHGLRAKDKSFNVEMVTHFDENLPKANIVQQDIGRVLLNLFNNAFYAVNQKQKTAGDDYKPTVTVSTFAPPSGPKDSFGGGWGVKVKDNGNGIPDNIKDKIMQPFFTTKPTGEGTGLGLSLSYDIVVKGHGGTITVESKEGEYTIFTVSLPA